MPVFLLLHEAAQHGVHAALPPATGALEELQHVRVKAHCDLTLILSGTPHQPGRGIGAAHPISGSPLLPGGITRHIRRELLLGFGSDRRTIGFVLAARLLRRELLSRVSAAIASFPHLSPASPK